MVCMFFVLTVWIMHFVTQKVNKFFTKEEKQLKFLPSEKCLLLDLWFCWNICQFFFLFQLGKLQYKTGQTQNYIMAARTITEINTTSLKDFLIGIMVYIPVAPPYINSYFINSFRDWKYFLFFDDFLMFRVAWLGKEEIAHYEIFCK